MRHFGSPLVPSVFDFGLNGKRPTHPQLLDWLAVEFMNGDQSQKSEIPNPKSQITHPAWRMKHIHRLIVTSNAYRQQSSTLGADESNRAIDPDNLYLWRMNVRRMEAEIIRDSTLFVAGRLDKTMAGPELDENSGMTGARRSVYFRNSKEKKMTFPRFVRPAQRRRMLPPQRKRRPPAGAGDGEQPPVARASEAVGQNSIGRIGGRFGSRSAKQVRRHCLRASLKPFPQRSRTGRMRQVPGGSARGTRFADPKLLTQFSTGTPSHVPAATDPHQRARENLVHVLLNHNDFLTIR